MSNIHVEMRDGRKLDFLDTGKRGPSYSNKIRYQAAFAIITDEWDHQTIILANEIRLITVNGKTEPHG
jgi:hypothetical protein